MGISALDCKNLNNKPDAVAERAKGKAAEVHERVKGKMAVAVAEKVKVKAADDKERVKKIVGAVAEKVKGAKAEKVKGAVAEKVKGAVAEKDKDEPEKEKDKKAIQEKVKGKVQAIHERVKGKVQAIHERVKGKAPAHDEDVEEKDDQEEGERRPSRPDGPRPDGPEEKDDEKEEDDKEEKDDEEEGDDEEDPFDVKDIMKMSKLVRNALAQMRKTIERFGKIVGNLKNDGNEKRTQRIHALRSHLMALKHNFEINAADAHKRVAGLKATVELAFKQAQERYGQLEKMTVHFKNALREFHMVVTEHDEVAWLLNLRGEGSSHLSGLYHSPTFQGMVLVLTDRVLFWVDIAMLDSDVLDYLSPSDCESIGICVELRQLDEHVDELAQLAGDLDQGVKLGL